MSEGEHQVGSIIQGKDQGKSVDMLFLESNFFASFGLGFDGKFLLVKQSSVKTDRRMFKIAEKFKFDVDVMLHPIQYGNDFCKIIDSFVDKNESFWRNKMNNLVINGKATDTQLTLIWSSTERQPTLTKPKPNSEPDSNADSKPFSEISTS